MRKPGVNAGLSDGFIASLLDDLHDAMRMRIYEHGAIIDHRVAIVLYAVF
jgi:hypothetical protein